MSREPSLYLQDILDACAEVEEFIRGIGFDEFKVDKLRTAATARNLEVIGEASNRLPQEVRAAMPDVPWEKIVGMRNILAHAYYNVDHLVVWTVTIQRLPELAHAVTLYMQRNKRA